MRPEQWTGRLSSILPSSSTGAAFPLPTEYAYVPDEPAYSEERFQPKYLRLLSDTGTNYCDPSSSAASLTCFRIQTDRSGRTDSFCVGRDAAVDRQEKRFTLDCQLKNWSAEEIANGVPEFGHFPYYSYQTGPQTIFNGFVRTGRYPDTSSTPGRTTSQGYSILIKREENITNLWHSLMEIFSLYMTLDVLRMTKNSDTNMPFFAARDVEQSQIVILDDYDEGPYWDLWTVFAKKPMTRLQSTNLDPPLDAGNLIVPLPGGSNPLWQGDWKVHSCENCQLLHTFCHRMLNFYDIKDNLEMDSGPLVLTYINRTETRRLIDQEAYINTLKASLQDVHIEVVDFAPLALPEQLMIVRRTDILVGVHGAGLTHGMFLRPGSTMVEILPPGLDHRGFRNLARLAGHRYFSSHALKTPEGAELEDWHNSDVYLEEERFVDLIGTAVKSMYNRRLLNVDVN